MDIPGYEGLYQIYEDGRIFSFLSDRFLKHRIDRKGYPYIGLFPEEKGKAKNHSIHRLLAEVYLSNPENKPQVDHKDNNPLNFHLNNLRWATQHENMKNIRKLSRNTSGYTGVYLNKKNKKWIAQLSAEGTVKYLGSYTTAEEASAAYQATAKVIYGEFYRETK